MLQKNCYLLFGGFIMIFTHVFSIPRMKFFQKIIAVSSNIPQEYFNNISKLIIAKDIVGYIFLIFTLTYIVIYDIQTLISVTYLHVSLVVFLADTQYINCVYVIEMCFKKINETLKNLKFTMMTKEPHLLRRTYHEQHNSLLLIEINKLQKEHHEVSDILKMLNSTYGLHVVASITMMFTEITFRLYFYILKLLRNNAEEIFELHFYIAMFYYVLKLTFIVRICENAKIQAQKIGNTVHDVLLSTHDVKIKEELYLFSLQLLHRNNVFCARGLVINFSLLNEITGAITMYLLILIQFHMSTPLVISNVEDKQ
ncbi:putative gustatory receptor 28b [Leptopilina boulardi]|uniref:putative gustatory receptor 28b n=1 Tax=Leptopilina boulardi TaxID=63433 RepID=UPI0021F617C7|nr:putative gustatory receptor 28b [Leptopilina boulardi]